MNTIIEEYFKITGRPIATMTVSEYLEFCRFSPSNNTQTSSWVDNKVARDKSINKTTPNNDTRVNTADKQPTRAKEVTEKPVHKDNQPAQVTFNVSPLDMLKSVSG